MIVKKKESNIALRKLNARYNFYNANFLKCLQFTLMQFDLQCSCYDIIDNLHIYSPFFAPLAQ